MGECVRLEWRTDDADGVDLIRNNSGIGGGSGNGEQTDCPGDRGLYEYRLEAYNGAGRDRRDRHRGSVRDSAPVGARDARRNIPGMGQRVSCLQRNTWPMPGMLGPNLVDHFSYRRRKCLTSLYAPQYSLWA
jgi:hypothetical protein